MPIDIIRHLKNKNYPPATQAKRVGWGVVAVLFRSSPNFFPGWRNFLLRCFGARIGRGVRIHPSVRVMFPWNLALADHVVIGHGANLYALAPISIASHVLISQGVHLCAGSHDYRQPHFPIAHAPITIGSGTWIAAEAFVGPGVNVGAGAVVGARSVVMNDVAARTLVAGNPARVVRQLSETA
ncbi:MAG TPA: WcaF family extracellular polysaccharide biosynthesis acetyltransferase [Opitutaceae bacterium]|nr:WcaF family extracellular polysaccharide biosynthesis acetyltransferase [Opitutaceae bacterium]